LGCSSQTASASAPSRSRGTDKEALLKLGAHYFIDSASDDVTEAFNHSGGV
jgi:hypothetical protein